MADHGKLNLAFLGCGYATAIHSRTLQGFRKEVNCHYASRDGKKAREYNAKFKGAGAFASYEEAISDSGIDAIFVATPPVNHRELALKALGAGKHVVVEKPPFMKASDFVVIGRAAANSSGKVFIAENYFYKPLAFQLRRLLSSRIIGEVLFVHVNAMKEQVVDGWREKAALSGGGALFEGGIHWVNFVANLGFEIKSVRGFRPGKKEGMEMSVLVALEYKEGAVGTLYHSWETPSLFKGLRLSKIYGSEGSITFESNGLVVIVRGRQKRIIFPGLKDIAGYKAMFRDFFRAIRDNTEPQFGLESAERDMRIIEDIYGSISHSDESC